MNYRRFVQFRFSTLLGLMTGIAIGFAPLKLWELWRAPSPMIAIQMEFLEVDSQVLAELFEQKPALAGDSPSIEADLPLTERLQTLRDQGRLDVLSRPAITTINGQTAVISVGQRLKAAPAELVGTDFKVTPTLMRNGLINLSYTLQVNEPGSIPAVEPSGPRRLTIHQRTLSAAVEARPERLMLISSTSVLPSKPSPSGREVLVLLAAKSLDSHKPAAAQLFPPVITRKPTVNASRAN
jgi:hypothetical protein